MKQRIAIVLGLLIFSTGSWLLAETDEEVEARKSVLDLAGAFSNDGFKVRDGYWTGRVKPQERAVIAVNLYAGNQYWFSTASNAKAKKIALDIFDESGKPMVTDNFNSGDKASAGFSPVNSGQYYVALGLLEGEATTFCLVYSYK